MGVLNDAWDWLTDAIDDAADWAEEAYEDVTEFIEETLEDIENLVEGGIDDLEDMVEHLEEQAEALSDYADDLHESVADEIEEMIETLEELAEDAQEALDEAVEWAEQAAEDAADAVEDAADDVADWGREAIEDAGEWAGQALQDAAEAVEDGVYDVINFDDGFHLDIGILEIDASQEDGFRFEVGADGVNLNAEIDIDADGDWHVGGGVETPILHAETEIGVEDGDAHVGASWGVDMSVGWIDIEGEQGWEWQQTDGGWRFDAYNEGEVGIFGVSLERDRTFGVGVEDGEASVYYTDEVALNLGENVEVRVGGGVKVTTDGTFEGSDVETGGFVRGQAFGEEAQAGEQIDTGVEEEMPEIVQNQQDWIDSKLAEDGPNMVDDVQAEIEDRLEADRGDDADGPTDDSPATPTDRPRVDLTDGDRPGGRRAPSDAFEDSETADEEPRPDERPDERPDRPARDAFDDIAPRDDDRDLEDDDRPDRPDERPDRPEDHDDLIAPQRGDGGRESTIGDPSHSPGGLERPDADEDQQRDERRDRDDRPEDDDRLMAIADESDALDAVTPVEIEDNYETAEGDNGLGAPRGDLLADDDDPLAGGRGGFGLDD